jgi:lipopolysaccharide transport system permease protein
LSTTVSASAKRSVIESIDRLEKLWQHSGTPDEYTAESPLKRPKNFLRVALRDLVSSSYTAYRLFRSQNAQRYRYSSLGFLWAFAPSAMTALIVTLGQRAHLRALSPTDIPGQFYAVFGLILLQTFLEPLNTQRFLFSGNRHLLSRGGPILEASLLAGLADNLFSMVLKLPLLVTMFLFCNVQCANTIVFGLFGVFLTSLMGTTAGLLLAPWAALKQDVHHMMIFVPWLALAATPVLIKPRLDSPLWFYYQMNPLTWIFDAVRDLSYGHATICSGTVLLLMLLVAIVGLPAAWLLCRIARPYVIERSLV